MERMLDLYTVTAQRETGFWIGVPTSMGTTVARSDWLQFMEADPEHFQLATLTAEEATGYSTAPEDIVERAVIVKWSDEGYKRG